MILYSAADLMWATRIKATGEELGVPCRPVRSVEMLEARLGDSDVRALLLDLDVPDRAMELIERLRGERAGERERGVRVLAWGPHVEKVLFQRVRDAGADEVLTRGAFSHELPEILLRLSSA